MKKVVTFLGLIAIFLLTACTDAQNTEQGQNVSRMEENYGDDIYGSVPMEDLRAAVLEVIGDKYWPDKNVTETDFQEKYGLTQEMYEDYFAEEAPVETSADALVIVKAAPGMAEQVEKLLNDYREKLVNRTDTTPENGMKHSASRIEAYGSYVCFVQLGADLTDLMEQGEDVVGNHCQEENEKALDAIRTSLLK